MSYLQKKIRFSKRGKRYWRTLHLVTDGIVDEKKWLESSPKILFVLKEANHKGKPHSASLSREWLYDGAGSNTWGNIALWTHAIRHYKENLQWSDEINLRCIGKGETQASFTNGRGDESEEDSRRCKSNKAELRESVKKHKGLCAVRLIFIGLKPILLFVVG